MKVAMAYLPVVPWTFFGGAWLAAAAKERAKLRVEEAKRWENMIKLSELNYKKIKWKKKKKKMRSKKKIKFREIT